MLSSLAPNYQSFLNSLGLIQQRLLTDETQLASGLKINQISDAPDQIGPLLQTRSQIAQLTQINQNLGQVQSETDASESALQSAVSIMDQVQSLATQGEPTNTSADTRTTISQQLGSALTNLVNLADTAVGGRFVFSGNSDQTQPYTIDLTQNNPVSAYAGSPATRQVQIPGGGTIAVALSAQQIFDSSSPQTNIFNAGNRVRLALQNNDQAGIDAAIPTLASAATYLNQQLATYGSYQVNVGNAITAGQTLNTQLQTQLANIQDANSAQVITDLQQNQMLEQAALGAEAQFPRTSLFNFLG